MDSTDEPEERSDRDVYMTKLHEDRQNNIVNVRCASSLTSTVLTWSHRTTNCDVISTITTTMPMKNGDMKDIKMYKFKAPSKKSSINMYQSPLENGLNDDKKARKMCCEILHKEKKAFMQQLHKSRTQRTTLETIASVIIQTRYRGFITRHKQAEIKQSCAMRHAVYGAMINYLKRTESPAVKSLGAHRNGHIAMRAHSATVIQCAFRCYLTRNFINRRRFEFEIDHMNQAAKRIQNLARYKMANKTVSRKRERTTLQRRVIGALKVQSQVRMLISRRKVAIRRFKLHWLAARMIQGCFRGRNTRKCMAVYKAAQEKVKFFRGARGLQQVVRGRIGRSRVNRIKLRYLYLKIFKAVTRIQTMARQKSAVLRVQKCKNDKKFQDQIRTDLILAEEKRKDVSEAESLVNGMDIFFQTRQGETSNVDALYHSDIEGGVASDALAHVVNDLGDTILSQASKCNHLDIIRKCIKWGYDVNHENALGENVIALAASEGHMSVVTYLLSDSQGNAAAILAAMPKKEKKMKKKKKAPPAPVVEEEGEKKDDGKEEGAKEEKTGKAEDKDGADTTFMTGQYDGDGEEKGAGEKKESEGENKESKEEPEEEEEEEEDEEVPVIKASNVLNLSAEDMGTILVAAAKHPDIVHLKMIIENDFITRINEVQPLTDLTALHVACEEGHVEHVDFLLKHGAKLNVKDDNGQIPLHKTAKKSLQLMQQLFELTAAASGADAAKEELLLKDSDGKDCFLIASLHGQTELVDFIRDHVDMSTRVISDEVGWSANDILNVSKLVEEGNLSCLQNVILEGFESAWCPEETGVTIAMIACQHGRTDIIDYLLTEVGADFSALDTAGMNSLHYAAHFTRKDIIPLLLSAGEKAKESCALANSLLTVQDEKGYTPVHYSAEQGSTLSFELLAQAEITAALALRDTNGCTPLLIACKYKQSNKIAELLKLEADAAVVDNKGKNALWHYFIQITEGPQHAITVNPTVELDILQALLKSGCPLFNTAKSPIGKDVEPMTRDIEHISSEFVALFGHDKALPSNQHEATFEFLLTHIQPTDLAAFENNLSFFNVLPSVLSPSDCWGAAVSALFFHPDMLEARRKGGGSGGGSSKCLASLFDGKAAAVLATLDQSDQKEKEAGSEEKETEKETDSTVANTDVLVTLQAILYNNISLLGWAITSKNEAALTFLLRKGMSPNAVVDTQGNNCLHWAVMFGSAVMVNVLLDSTGAVTSEVMLLEGANTEGHSASMLGARGGTYDTTRAVIQMGASPRRALGGKYWAWILALAVQCESRQINSQTGVYGDDDELYFPLHPNHNLMYD